jgi:TPR repeat protein
MRKEPSIEAGFTRAWALLDDGHAREAFRLFLSAAKAGHLGAQVVVGYLYDAGKGVRRSRDLALCWYRKAARRGDASAANNIATVYRDDGRLRLAMRWFDKAVSLGNADSLLEMARLYAGPLNDKARARRLIVRLLSSKAITEESREQGLLLQQQLSS